MSKKKYYSVTNGRTQGVFDDWNKCRKKVEGYKGAIYKSFTSFEDALNFLKNEGNPSRGGVLSIGERDEFYKTFGELCAELQCMEVNK